MYSAKEIDRMSIDELEGLGSYLSPEQMSKWSGMGYDGKTFVELTKEQLVLTIIFRIFRYINN